MAADPEDIIAVEKKYKFTNPQYPILYDDGRLQVYKNHCNEIFIEDILTGVSIRINSIRNRGLEFTTDGRVEPAIVGNMIGWSISR